MNSNTDYRYFRIVAPKGFDGHVDRHEYTFKTKNAAAEFKLRIKRWKAEQKSPSDTLSFDDYDKRWLAYLRAHVGNLELLPEIVRHWEATAKAITSPLSVAELCKAFVLYRETRRLGKGTLGEDRFVAKRLREVLGARQAHEVNASDIRTFLGTAKSQSIERKLYKVASLIFDYAKEQRSVVVNPFAEIDRPQVDYGTPATLTADQFKSLLVNAEKLVPDIVPFLALAGFAGIRREEMLREYAEDSVLQWEDIDWEKNIITIREEVAKKTSRKSGNRRWVPMEPALIHWLAPYRKASGPIVPVADAAFRRRTDKLKTALKTSFPRNALRHSFATYWLARSSLDGVGRLAVIMGNSETTAKKHYIEPLGPSEGETWFSIRRAKSAPLPLRVLDAA